MELNITLGIQILNFFIAWFLLHVLLFKPAIRYMQAEQKAHDQRLEGIAIWQTRIIQKEQEATLVWNDLNVFVMQHKPDITPVPNLHMRYADAQIPSQHPEQDALTKTLKDILVTGISNVDI